MIAILNCCHGLPEVCEIGLDISHTQYHMHGAYLIDHSDLMGFSKATAETTGITG